MPESPASASSTGLTFYFPGTELHVDASDAELLRHVGNVLMRTVFDRPFESRRPSRHVRIYCQRKSGTAASAGIATRDVDAPGAVAQLETSCTSPVTRAWSPQPRVHTPTAAALDEQELRDGDAVARIRRVGDGRSVLLEIPAPCLEEYRDRMERFVERVVDATLPADAHLWVHGVVAIGFSGDSRPRPECLLLTGDAAAVDCATRTLAAQSFHVPPGRRQRLVVVDDAISVARPPRREAARDETPHYPPAPRVLTRILHFESATRPPRSGDADRRSRVRESLLDSPDNSNCAQLAESATSRHPILEQALEQAEIFKVIWQPEDPHSAARTALKILGLQRRAVSAPRTWQLGTTRH